MTKEDYINALDEGLENYKQSHKDKHEIQVIFSEFSSAIHERTGIKFILKYQPRCNCHHVRTEAFEGYKGKSISTWRDSKYGYPVYLDSSDNSVHWCRSSLEKGLVDLLRERATGEEIQKALDAIKKLKEKEVTE